MPNLRHPDIREFDELILSIIKIWVSEKKSILNFRKGFE